MEARWIAKLIAAVLLCQLAGVVGAAFTVSTLSNWYATLNKPLFTPPGYVFAPVWIALYSLMGVSLYLAWEKYEKAKAKHEAGGALAVFGVQLLLNPSWSFAFFGLKSPLFALFVVILLWLAIAVTILRFRKISKTAAYLLVPYLLWVTFAVVLNVAIVRLN